MVSSGFTSAYTNLMGAALSIVVKASMPTKPRINLYIFFITLFLLEKLVYQCHTPFPDVMVFETI